MLHSEPVSDRKILVPPTPQYEPNPLADANLRPTEAVTEAPTHAGPDRGFLKKEVLRVGERVYCATGFALSNSIMIEVDGGKVIVDATESVRAAREIRAHFDALVPGPVKAIIYTHAHPDHFLGASAFHGEAVPIWAHERTSHEMSEQFGGLARPYRTRGARMFGEKLGAELLDTNAIGPKLRFDDGPVPPILYPTHTFTGQRAIEIGGVRFELHEAPGETADQIFVWLPKEKTLLAADNIYRSFPNLYSIRGVPPRPVKEWIRSLDAMRALEPDHLVPGHTEPLSGNERIRDTLRTYRDGIAYVHDAVIQAANEGRSVQDMQHEIRLPPHLARHPYLQETYGKVSWSVLGIYHGYFGWFDGNPTNLERLHPRDSAAVMLPLMGGREKVLGKAKELIGTGVPKNAQAAAELADIVLASDSRDRLAVRIKADALSVLGHSERNKNARGYLFSSALELDGKIAPSVKPRINLETITSLPIDVILHSFPERLNPRTVGSANMTVGFDFEDTGRRFTFRVRQGVGEVREDAATGADLVFASTEDTFKAFLTGTIGRTWALLRGRVKLSGGTSTFDNLKRLRRFSSYLTPA